MSEASVPFYTQVAILDEFIHAPDPAADRAMMEIVLDAISEQADLRDYFFRNRPSLAWLPVLWDHGFFSYPPPPLPSEKGLLLPRWGAQDYLASVAAEAPDFVLQHIATIDAHPVYIASAVACLLQLPQRRVEEAIPYIITWLSDLETANHLRDLVEGLIMQVAQNGSESAFVLFEALIRPFPNPAATVEQSFARRHEAVSIIGEERFEDATFRAILDMLARANPQRLIAVLENTLLLALRLEVSTEEASTLSSNWWRPAIEPSGQNWNHHYKDNLVDSLRDACERWIKEDVASARVLVERYLASGDIPVLRRLGLHLIRAFRCDFQDMVAHELVEPTNYDEAENHHEFMRLLEEGYSLLDEDDRLRVLDNIRAGPPQEQIEQLAVRVTARQEDEHEDEMSKEDYIQGYNQYWKLNRLWMIRDQLSGTLLDELQSLIAELGEPNHPTFLSWSSGVFSVSEVSPLPIDQLGDLDPQQLLTFLREWEPPAERSFGPEHVSREGLGLAVAELVIQNITASQPYLNELCLIHPVYTAPIIRHLARAAEQGNFIASDWLVCMGLCEVLLAQEDIRISMDRPERSGWRDVRRSIVDLLEVAVDRDDSTLPPELLPRLRDLLILLLSDPDPSVADDHPPQGWLGHGDPHAVALNHVRPKALSGLIHYALHVSSATQDTEAGVGPARLEQIVLDALSRSLDDSSLAVRSIYGQHLMLLYWLDQDWLTQHLLSIFPEGDTEESIAMYVAAWDAYVIFNKQLDPDLYRQMYSHYERAIENLKKGFVTRTHLQPVESLIAHLILFYFKDLEKEGQVENHASLLHRFFQVTDGEKRGRAAWAFWRRCKDHVEAGELSETWWPRARALWQYRIDSAASQNFPSDFDQEMGWFCELLDIAPADESLSSMWPLLQGTLPYVAPIGFRHQAWESLEKFIAHQVETDSVRSIELYTQMHARSHPPSWSRNEEMRRILEVSASRPESRRKALALLDTMARRGDLRLRDIYERYAF